MLSYFAVFFSSSQIFQCLQRNIFSQITQQHSENVLKIYNYAAIVNYSLKTTFLKFGFRRHCFSRNKNKTAFYLSLSTTSCVLCYDASMYVYYVIHKLMSGVWRQRCENALWVNCAYYYVNIKRIRFILASSDFEHIFF